MSAQLKYENGSGTTPQNCYAVQAEIFREKTVRVQKLSTPDEARSKADTRLLQEPKRAQ